MFNGRFWKYNSIYYRKPILSNFSSYDSPYHLLIQRYIISMINGIIDSLHGKVITKPLILRKKENKVFQMLCASNQRGNISKSYIGNNTIISNEFIRDLSIIKPLASGEMPGNYIK